MYSSFEFLIEILRLLNEYAIINLVLMNLVIYNFNTKAFRSVGSIFVHDHGIDIAFVLWLDINLEKYLAYIYRIVLVSFCFTLQTKYLRDCFVNVVVLFFSILYMWSSLVVYYLQSEQARHKMIFYRLRSNIPTAERWHQHPKDSKYL